MEIKEYISALDKNTGDVMQLLKDCSEADLERKKEGAWTILEILEHLWITDRVVYAMLARASKNLGDKAEIVGTATLRRYMIDLRRSKITAPELLLPKGEIKAKRSLLKNF